MTGLLFRVTVTDRLSRREIAFVITPLGVSRRHFSAPDETVDAL